MGLVRGRHADVPVLRGRQPGPHLRHPARRARLRRARPAGRPALLLHRRPGGRHRRTLAAAGAALGPRPRGQVPPAADGHRPHARHRRPGPLRPPRPQGRDGDDHAGVRGDVHRGGRRLPAGRRRRTALPGPGRRTRRLRALLRPPGQGRQGPLQGRDRRGDPACLPDPGRVGGPRAPGQGPRRPRHGRGPALRAGRRGPRGQPLRQRLQHRRAPHLPQGGVPGDRRLHECALLNPGTLPAWISRSPPWTCRPAWTRHWRSKRWRSASARTKSPYAVRSSSATCSSRAPAPSARPPRDAWSASSTACRTPAPTGGRPSSNRICARPATTSGWTTPS
ncbi:hypothetical protein SGPA1_11359 [Streptomyces misionensis JCM 4497]